MERRAERELRRAAVELELGREPGGAPAPERVELLIQARESMEQAGLSLERLEQVERAGRESGERLAQALHKLTESTRRSTEHYLERAGAPPERAEQAQAELESAHQAQAAARREAVEASESAGGYWSSKLEQAEQAGRESACPALQKVWSAAQAVARAERALERAELVARVERAQVELEQARRRRAQVGLALLGRRYAPQFVERLEAAAEREARAEPPAGVRMESLEALERAQREAYEALEALESAAR